MKRRRHRSRKKSWFSRIFKKPRPTLGGDAIAPQYLRQAGDKTEIKEQAAPEHFLTEMEHYGNSSETLPVLRQGLEPIKRRKRRASFWMSFFIPRRRKHIKKNQPLFQKPVDPEPKRSRWQMSRRVMITVNSTFMYLIAFVAIYIIYQMAVIFTANHFGISGVLNYYTVFWPIGNSSPLWFPYYKIILITGSGPLISLIIGLIFFRLLVPYAKSPVLKLFYLWIALHALNMFFGGFVSGVTTSDGFGYVALWLRMNIAFRIFFALLFLFSLAAFGYYSTRYFLETALSPSFLSHEHRRMFLFYHVLLPSILGALIVLLVRIPNNPPYQVIVLATLLAATITAVFNRRAKPDRIKSFPKHHGRKLQVAYLMVMLLLLMVFRWGLSYGLHFIINIDFTVSVFGSSPM